MRIELASCIIVDEYDRLLLLHRYRGPHTQWELPGGKIEEGETAEAAAIRELQEELGIGVRLVKSLGSGTFTDQQHEYLQHWFQATVIDGPPTVMETHAFDDYDYFEVEDLLSLALSSGAAMFLEKMFSGDVVPD